mgnify:CR=1 FL=1
MRQGYQQVFIEGSRWLGRLLRPFLQRRVEADLARLAALCELR